MTAAARTATEALEAIMTLADSISLKVDCMLRRVGLSGVSRTALGFVALLLAVLLAFAVWRFWPAAASSGADFEVSTGAAEQTSAETDGTSSTGEIYVDVEGAVANPGMYVLSSGARVNDAVEAAGGLKKSASRQSINLAEALEDGSQVYVCTKSEAAASGTTASASSSTSSTSPSSSTSSSSSGSSGDGSALININTASETELQELSGIGEALSSYIVAYRESNGAFTSIEEITNVSGIGEATYESIKDYICV